jgi:plastocyanin
MKIQSWAIIGAMLIVAGCHTASPLSSEQRELAKFTRTGAIHDIRIGEVVTPPQITVKPGDEVRWVNVWTSPGQLVFTDSLVDRVSCQNKFSGKDATILAPNDYISLCFSSPGTYKYIARMGSPVPGGERNLSGIVQVQIEDITPVRPEGLQPVQSNRY